MSLPTAVRKVSLRETILGVNFPVSITIDNNFIATIDFGLLKTPDSFRIERWSGRELDNFLNFFHKHESRDVAYYGLRMEDASGNVHYFEDNVGITVDSDGNISVGNSTKAMTMVQKLNCVERGAKEIIVCFGQIAAVRQRSMLEYAVWYQENHEVPTTYSEYITLATCYCIANSDFIAANVNW